jgi:WD40 repeat protein
MYFAVLREGAVDVLSADSHTLLRTLDVGARVIRLCFSPADGVTLATGSTTGYVVIWDVESGEEKSNFRATQGPFIRRFTQDGSRLVTAAIQQFTLWDLSAQQLVWTYNIDYDKHLLFCGLCNGDCSKVWMAMKDVSFKQNIHLKQIDAADGKELPQLEIRHKSFGFRATAAVPRSSNLLAIGTNEGIIMWDVDKKEIQRTVKTKSSIDYVCFSPDATLAATSEYSRVITVWDSAFSEPVLVYEFGERAYMLSFNASGDRLCAHGENGVVRVLDIHAGTELFNAPAALCGCYSHTGNILL